MSVSARDNEIRPDDILYRRFFPRGKKHRVPLTAYVVKRTGQPDPEISVYLARLTTAEEVMRNQPAGLTLGIILVQDVLDLGFRVRPDPQPGDPAHCVIEGVMTNDDCDRLADKTRYHESDPAGG